MLRGIKINESIMTNFEFTELAKKTANLMLTISSKQNVIRILPRLNLTKDELDDFSFRMKKTLSVI
jgi:acetylornithine/succinyldiaminopimelate/putrescine aminotransferase